MKQHDIDFVARHYRRGAFDAGRGWKRLSLTTRSGWRRFRVAASIAVVIAIGATAAIFLTRPTTISTDPVPVEEFQTTSSVLTEVRTIDFDNAPLGEVVTAIHDVYGVEIGNLPQNSDELCLSMHYEGNVEDLVASINEILNCELVILQ